MNLAYSSDLIASVAGDANVVPTLKSELDIADLKDLAATLLCILACCLKDLIDEVVRDIEDGLYMYQWMLNGEGEILKMTRGART